MLNKFGFVLEWVTISYEQMKLSQIKSFYRSLALTLALFPVLSGHAFFVNVGDTLAGSEASLQISGLIGNEGVSAILEKPDSSKINLSFQADSQGNVNNELYGLHLKDSGPYALTVVRNQAVNLTESHVFKVLAGSPSVYRSTVKSSVATLPADGQALTQVSVSVQDAYGNAVPNQNVKLFSSRNDDVINFAGVTDNSGIVKGTVASTTPGVSVLSALVNDEIIFEKSEIVFHLASTSNVGVGQSGFGQFLKAQLFTDDFEEVKYLTIEGLQPEVRTEDGLTFKILAKDNAGNIVKNYEGQVRFSSNDSGASLPVDYSFTRTDQGEHEFAVAAAFSTPGVRTLTVTDIEDPKVNGKVELNVVSKDRLVEPPVGEGLVILTPSAGTFSSPRMTITGRGEPGTPIKVTDGPTILVEDLSLDINGDFFYQTPALADGRHIFRAEYMDGTLFSNVAEIRIDNTPPRVLAVDVTPKGAIGAGGTFTVSVSSNEPLSTATCTFNRVATPLNRSGDVFVGDISAGRACGTFPVGCTVADILGNELQENAAAEVQVCGNEPVVITPDVEPVEDIIEEAVVANLPPTAVSSLSAAPGEKRVTLNWSPARDDKAVAQYQILFGEDPQNLYGVNLTPDNRTQWYIDKLKEATRYYVQVVAIDSDGNKGTTSNMVETTTFGEVLLSAAVPESGNANNLWLPLLLSFLGGILFLTLGRRKG